jgi:hypothetical protein
MNEGLSAMTDAEASLGIDLGHGETFVRKQEEGVVAEAAGAAGDGENLAFNGAVCGGEDCSVFGQREDASIAGGAIFFTGGGECVEQAEVVALVYR